MARSRHIYTIKEVAVMLGENLELLEETTANSDNIAKGELFFVRDGSDDGTTGLTENGVNDFQDLLSDIRTWDGGVQEFLVSEQCDQEIIERIPADELKRQPQNASGWPQRRSPDAYILHEDEGGAAPRNTPPLAPPASRRGSAGVEAG